MLQLQANQHLDFSVPTRIKLVNHITNNHIIFSNTPPATSSTSTTGQTIQYLSVEVENLINLTELWLKNYIQIRNLLLISANTNTNILQTFSDLYEKFYNHITNTKPLIITDIKKEIKQLREAINKANILEQNSILNIILNNCSNNLDNKEYSPIPGNIIITTLVSPEITTGVIRFITEKLHLKHSKLFIFSNNDIHELRALTVICTILIKRHLLHLNIDVNSTNNTHNDYNTAHNNLIKSQKIFYRLCMQTSKHNIYPIMEIFLYLYKKNGILTSNAFPIIEKIIEYYNNLKILHCSHNEPTILTALQTLDYLYHIQFTIDDINILLNKKYVTDNIAVIIMLPGILNNTNKISLTIQLAQKVLNLLLTYPNRSTYIHEMLKLLVKNKKYLTSEYIDMHTYKIRSVYPYLSTQPTTKLNYRPLRTKMFPVKQPAEELVNKHNQQAYLNHLQTYAQLDQQITTQITTNNCSLNTSQPTMQQYSQYSIWYPSSTRTLDLPGSLATKPTLFYSKCVPSTTLSSSTSATTNMPIDNINKMD
jgi:hypothetical protein